METLGGKTFPKKQPCVWGVGGNIWGIVNCLFAACWDILTCEGRRDKIVREGDILRLRRLRGAPQRFPVPVPEKGRQFVVAVRTKLIPQRIQSVCSCFPVSSFDKMWNLKDCNSVFTLGLLSQTGAPDNGGGGGGGVDAPSLKLLLLHPVASDFGLVKRFSCEESWLSAPLSAPFLVGRSEPSCIVIPAFPGSDGAGYGGAGQGGQGAGQGGQGVGHGGAEASCNFCSSWRPLPSTPILRSCRLLWSRARWITFCRQCHTTYQLWAKKIEQVKHIVYITCSIWDIFWLCGDCLRNDNLSAVWREAKKEQIYWTWLWASLFVAPVFHILLSVYLKVKRSLSISSRSPAYIFLKLIRSIGHWPKDDENILEVFWATKWFLAQIFSPKVCLEETFVSQCRAITLKYLTNGVSRHNC